MIEKIRNEFDLTINKKDLLLYQTLLHLKNLPYGEKSVVGASIYDIETQRIVYANSVSANDERNDNLWYHAEYMAVKLALEGLINPSKAIVITTLSPCINESSYRAHESCTDILLEAGFRNIHTGMIDRRQATLDKYKQLGFDMTVTQDPKLSKICSELDSFFNEKPSNHLQNFNKQDYLEDVLKDLPNLNTT